MGTVREMFGLVERVRPFLLDATLIPYAALVVDYDFSVSDNAKGFYQALIEHHVPFTVVSSRKLGAETLKDFSVVALPNVTRLSDEQIDALQDYHAVGGGVVFTYRTGCHREDGTMREGTPLAEMAGISGPFGVVTNPSGPAAEDLPHTYYRFTTDHPVGEGMTGRLQSFRGSYADVVRTSATTIAQALDYDYSKMHRHHPAMGWYPGHAASPMVVVNEPSGGGRVVYFAGEFDRESYTLGLPGPLRALAQAAEWAASCPPPIETDCGPTVEIATHYSPSRRTYTVILVNQTTNDIWPGMVVRHVETLHDINLKLRGLDSAIVDVQSLTGGKIDWHRCGDHHIVVIHRLHEYDAVVVYVE